MGWENMFHCEWNPFGQKVLNYYWPNAKSYGDITKTDFSEWRGKVDIVTGGVPCQPASTAGKRKGTSDDRWLWPETFRVIREVCPGWVILENVRGLLNLKRGMVFDSLFAEMEAMGYEVTPFLLPACAKNAPHRRDRIWIVAHSNSNGQHRSNGKYEINTSERRKYALNDIEPITSTNSGGSRLQANDTLRKPEGEINTSGIDGENLFTNTECIGQQESGRSQRQSSPTPDRNWKASWSEHDGGWPTQSPICTGDDGLSSELDGITVSKWRKESLMGAGNAIVPQVAYEIFKAIEECKK